MTVSACLGLLFFLSILPALAQREHRALFVPENGVHMVALSAGLKPPLGGGDYFYALRPRYGYQLSRVVLLGADAEMIFDNTILGVGLPVPFLRSGVYTRVFPFPHFFVEGAYMLGNYYSTSRTSESYIPGLRQHAAFGIGFTYPVFQKHFPGLQLDGDIKTYQPIGCPTCGSDPYAWRFGLAYFFGGKKS